MTIRHQIPKNNREFCIYLLMIDKKVEEFCRVEQKEFWYLNLKQAITRAFGDHSLKNKVIINVKKGLTVDPFVKKQELRMINKYVIIASDGIWDVI